MNALLADIPEWELVKGMGWIIANDIWDEMSSFYESDSKVKQAKVQDFIMKFESLKMHDDEDISKYFLRVDQVVNTIIGLGEELK